MSPSAFSPSTQAPRPRGPAKGALAAELRDTARRAAGLQATFTCSVPGCGGEVIVPPDYAPGGTRPYCMTCAQRAANALEHGATEAQLRREVATLQAKLEAAVDLAPIAGRCPTCSKKGGHRCAGRCGRWLWSNRRMCEACTAAKRERACACGAPLARGRRFCDACARERAGKPRERKPTVVPCRGCGRPVPQKATGRVATWCSRTGKVRAPGVCAVIGSRESAKVRAGLRPEGRA